MNFAGWILKHTGWEFVVNIPPTPKCVICVAPHTSNWDFVLGELAARSVGIKAGFLMKSTWFFWPMGYLMRAIGGIAVKQHEHTNVTESVIHEFEEHDNLAIAVTPEGTRSRNEHWHKGFLHIAREAHVPIVLGYIDYAKRIVCLDRLFTPGDDIEADLEAVKTYYSRFTGKHPEKFTT